jgi:hypothetical protein
MLQHVAQGPAKHQALDVPPSAEQLFGAECMVHPLQGLLDDRAFVEVGRREVGGGADQLDAARVRLGVGLGPCM